MKAYPYMHKHPTSGQTTISEGMDLRDYFAAKVLQGMLASGNLPKTMPDADIAECSYNLADAMMKQRNKKEVSE